MIRINAPVKNDRGEYIVTMYSTNGRDGSMQTFGVSGSNPRHAVLNAQLQEQERMPDRQTFVRLRREQDTQSTAIDELYALKGADLNRYWFEIRFDRNAVRCGTVMAWNREHAYQKIDVYEHSIEGKYSFAGDVMVWDSEPAYFNWFKKLNEVHLP